MQIGSELTYFQSGVVYRPDMEQTDLATAKILYGNKSAADRALKYEVS